MVELATKFSLPPERRFRASPRCESIGDSRQGALTRRSPLPRLFTRQCHSSLTPFVIFDTFCDLTRRIRPQNAGVPEGQRDSVRLVPKLARMVTDMNFDLLQRDRLLEFTWIREVQRDQVSSCGGLVRF